MTDKKTIKKTDSIAEIAKTKLYSKVRKHYESGVYKHVDYISDLKDIGGDIIIDVIKSEQKEIAEVLAERYGEKFRWCDLNTLDKMCCYWFSGNLKAEPAKIFDCDGTYEAWLGYLSYPNFEKNKYAQYGETITSSWSLIKKYLGLTGGKFENVKLIIKNQDEIFNRLDECGAIEFLKLAHTVGNFMPVPKLFNVSRTGYNAKTQVVEWDRADIMLKQIYEYYNGAGSAAMEKLLERRNKKEPGNKDCKGAEEYCCEWLDCFDSWEDFAKCNYFETVEPKPLCANYGIDNPYPDSQEEWKVLFGNLSKWIQKRSEKIASKNNLF